MISLLTQHITSRDSQNPRSRSLCGIGWSKLRPDRLADSEPWYFVKLGLFLYVLWLGSFEAAGLYAATLPSHDLTSALDRMIPPMPQFVWPYILCYAFPFILALVARDWHRVNCGLLSMLFAHMTALVVYLAYPVAFPKPVPGPGLSERVLNFQYVIDFHPGANNLPSLHVAFAWLVYFMCRKQGLRKIAEHALFLAALLVTFSTLFVKQHIVADAITGVLWAIGAWIAARFFYPRWKETDADAKCAFWQMARRSIPFVAITVLLMAFFALQR